ncbi:MAG: GNAT family N-acetyltransferase [Chlorobium sp.]|nr:MAG: GNAT family N-acetyltransferase [Chlorobium sp.]
MAKSYRLERASLNLQWDEFMRSSPDSTVFSLSSYLGNAGVRLGLFYCFNADEPRAAVVLSESEDGSSAQLDDLIIYSGISYGKPLHRQSRAQQLSERHEIALFIAEELAEHYEHIEFTLSPSVSDIRPFLWYRYGEDTGRYQVNTRYTSYLPIADFASALSLEDIEAYREASVSRRQQIRYAKRDRLITEEFRNVDLFIDFYRQTMTRQKEEPSDAKLERMAQLVEGLLQADLAKMFVSKTAEGVAGSIAVYAYDQLRAYYLFGASDPALRDTPAGTAVLWDAFFHLAAMGLPVIDLEGVNSPKRGWFKLSFGGDLRPYYQICKHE